jgi:hypothetical protein
MRLWLCAMLLLALIGTSPAHAGGRVALVIGNSNYTVGGKLTNPVNDMRLVEKSLRDAGFDVTPAPELSWNAFQDALHVFHDKARGSEIALIYYAGHGIAGKGTNWMVPIDAELHTPFELDTQAIPLDRIVETTQGAQLRVVIVDACRDNPFGRNWQSQSRAVATGLAKQDYDDVLVIFSAAPGQTASDGGGTNSPFASSLAHRILQPQLAVQMLGGMVRDDVLKETGGEQRPYVDASVTGNPVFLVTGPVNVTLEQPRRTLERVDPASIEALVWQGALAANSTSSFADYLRHYPTGTFATQAQENLRRLQSATLPSQAATPGFSVPGIQARNFADVPTSTAPAMTVSAAPYLHNGVIGLKVRDVLPFGSEVIFINNRHIYDGRAIIPTVSENMLTQQGTGNVPASFTLQLPQPVAAIRFLVPRLYPDTTSGVTFPAWTATALSMSGAVLDSRHKALARRMDSDIPGEVVVLTAPAFEGISAVRFDSDPRLNGTPFAGFSTILIEGFWIEPMK